MRLACPNCAAQYEVPDGAIPPQGREVQCSACAHSWFEQPVEGRPKLIGPDPLAAVPQVEGDDEEADDLVAARVDPAPVAPRPPEPAPAPSLAPRPTLEAVTAPVGAVERPRVAPEVERILREEAEHEARARAEAAAKRLMPDPEPVAEAPRKLRSLDEDDGPLVREGAAQAGRVIPMNRPARQVEKPLDLDQINSTLRSHGDLLGAKAPQVEGARRRRRGGFLSGFTGALLILGVLAALYIWRVDIVELVPQAAVVLDPYASAVDQGRFWLDRELARLLGATSVGL